MTNVATLKPVKMRSKYNPPVYSLSYVCIQVFNTMWVEKCESTKNKSVPWMIIDLENMFDKTLKTEKEPTSATVCLPFNAWFL